MRKREKILYEESGLFIFMRKMNSSRWKDAGLVLAYMIFYLCFFNYLEHRTGVQVHMLQMRADYKIPFCEYFIVPYLLWFPYVGLTAVYFTLFNDNRTEFYQFAVCMGIGMTLFLMISYVFPNGQNLRPYTFARHNICTELVQHLYKIDTPTNVMPSLHVFNSVMCCTAIWESRSLRKNKLVRWGSWVLTLLIIAATMFLKQHTILDVVVALAMARICWFFMYRYKVQTVVEYEEV